MKNQLFGSFLEKMFRQCTRLNFDTFHVLVRVVGPSLERENTNMRENIHVEAREAMVLARLGCENSLQMYAEVYGIVESTTSIIVRNVKSSLGPDH
jgi:ABC-type Na+ transport system ATPase subunit NatA